MISDVLEKFGLIHITNVNGFKVPISLEEYEEQQYLEQGAQDMAEYFNYRFNRDPEDV